MKKNFFKAVVLGVALMTSASASAQIDLGSLAKGVEQVLGNNLTSIISGNNNVTKEWI